jgi:hypothetical protein
MVYYEKNEKEDIIMITLLIIALKIADRELERRNIKC